MSDTVVTADQPVAQNLTPRCRSSLDVKYGLANAPYWDCGDLVKLSPSDAEEEP